MSSNSLNYKNPLNIKEILEDIKNSPTIVDIKPILEKTFPNWIVGGMLGYSKDYSYLEKNWEEICKIVGTPKAQIVIVDKIPQGEEYTLIHIFTEILTKTGFCVRTTNDLFPCKKCGLALPQEEFYDKLITKNIIVPSRWSTICENC
jgi:hypothetical protein